MAPKFAVINPRNTNPGGVTNEQFSTRRIIKIPAVTSVLLWTNAETGVGAAIAKGSQVVNGNWADLVEAPKTNKSLANDKLRNKKGPAFENQTIRERSKKASPNRIVKKTWAPLILPFKFLYHRINHKDVNPRPSHPTKNIVKVPEWTRITIDSTNANRIKSKCFEVPKYFKEKNRMKR